MLIHVPNSSSQPSSQPFGQEELDIAAQMNEEEPRQVTQCLVGVSTTWCI